MRQFLRTPIRSIELYMVMTSKTLTPDGMSSIIKSQSTLGRYSGMIYEVRIHGSDHLKTVLAFYEQDFEQPNSQLCYQKLKTKVKRCMGQRIRARNFEARGERIETGVPAKDRSKEKPVTVEKKSENAINVNPKDSAQEETLVVSVKMSTNVDN